MRPRALRVLLVLTAGVAIRCGSNATLPSAPSGTVQSVVVKSSGPTLFLGASETFTITATLANGGVETVTGGTWSSDTPSVATVNPTTGSVMAVGNGQATISVVYQGVHGSKQIQVLPNYNGNWTALYDVTACTQTGGWVASPNYCGTQLAVGQSLQYAFAFTQTANSYSGLIGILGVQFVVNPTTIAADGSSVIQTSGLFGTTLVNLTFNLTYAQANVINGTVMQNWTDSTLTGETDVTATLRPPTRTSAATGRLGRMVPTRLPTGPAHWVLGNSAPDR